MGKFKSMLVKTIKRIDELKELNKLSKIQAQCTDSRIPTSHK